MAAGASVWASTPTKSCATGSVWCCAPRSYARQSRSGNQPALGTAPLPCPQGTAVSAPTRARTHNPTPPRLLPVLSGPAHPRLPPCRALPRRPPTTRRARRQPYQFGEQQRLDQPRHIAVYLHRQDCESRPLSPLLLRYMLHDHRLMSSMLSRSSSTSAALSAATSQPCAARRAPPPSSPLSASPVASPCPPPDVPEGHTNPQFNPEVSALMMPAPHMRTPPAGIGRGPALCVGVRSKITLQFFCWDIG